MKKKLFFLGIFIILLSFSIFYTLKIANSTNNSNIESESEPCKIVSTNTKNTISNNSSKSSEQINSIGSVVITVPEFLNNMQCTEYTLKKGDTLTSIANKYISTCTLKSALKLIKEASNISDANSISTGTKIYIPETILKNGYLHTITSGDTWSKICTDYYPIYDANYMCTLLKYINDLPDNSLPLGTEIYLPNINI